MNDLLIVGASGHGKVVVETAEAMGKWNNIAFLDDNYENIVTHHGYPVLDSVESSLNHREQYSDIFVALGDNNRRIEFLNKFSLEGFNIPNIIHPSAIISKSVIMNNGVFVMANAVLNASSAIGYGAIINSSAVVEHDCVIGEGTHISPGVRLAGNVKVGSYSWIGIGSSVIQDITIGNNVVVGAGAVVINDISNNKKVIGNPAK